MTYMVIALGAIIAIGGVLGVFLPALVASTVGNISFASRTRYVLAFGRFTIGVILYITAYQTKFPITIQIFAMLTVLNGILDLVINPTTVQRWIEQASHWPAITWQFMSVLAVALGVFLIYAAF
jgi:uncharacterized protein YjeT (DUF2065 family)